MHACLMCVVMSLFAYHLPALPLDPLVKSFVTCQRLTSLELRYITLSLQSWKALVKGLHNLRALGLEWVDLSNEEVSDCLSCINCRQSVAVFEVFNMSCNSIVVPYSHSLPQMSTSLHHQWNTTPV